MYINEFISVEIKNIKKKQFVEKTLKSNVEIGKRYELHWSLLKTSSLRRSKIIVKCDVCGKFVEKRLCDLDVDVSSHFCRSCSKIGNRNPMFEKFGSENPNFGQIRECIAGENNPSKRKDVRQKISDRQKMTIVDFISKSDKVHLGKYDYSEVIYNLSGIKVKIICPIHGVFLQTPNQHLMGHGCSNCNSSKGERSVEKILLDNDIEYVKEKTFDDCKGIRRQLPFDFYLPKYNICIEYDGRQHFEPVERFGGTEGFSETLKNDKIKNDYCSDRNIKLIRIKYNKKIDIINIIKQVI